MLSRSQTAAIASVERWQAVAYLRCEIAQFTNWGILFEYDLTVAIRENLQRVTLANTHCAAYLLRDNDPAQIVNTPYYPCCFHIYDPPYFCCTVIFSAMLQKICRNPMCVFTYSPSMRSYMLFYIYSTSFMLSWPQVILRFPFRQRRASRKSFGTLSPFKTIRYSSS